MIGRAHANGKGYLRVRNQMNHIKIRVKPPATVHAFQFQTVPKEWRETVNKVCAYQSVQFLEPWYEEGTLDSRRGRQSTEIRSDTKVGNFTK